MSNKTVQYKRTLRGSVGAGVNALFNGNGRRYFILEHKDASKYHRVGESQKIIVDQVELGRDSNCQVRFDDSLSTVSRRHAAIIKDGERWKLVQLSKTNSTLLNGRPVDTEWYLENGDEIQLSVGGPRMGFIVPAGKQSLVSSIRMTERLELFRKQALRPYKTAIACLSCFMVIAIVAIPLVFHDLKREIQVVKTDSEENKSETNNRLDTIQGSLDTLRKESENFNKRLENIKPVVIVQESNSNLDKMYDKVKNDIFYISTTRVVVTDGTNEIEVPGYGWGGTGFLTTDGRFITAKHCVCGWLFPRTGGVPNDLAIQDLLIDGMSTNGKEIVAYFVAHSIRDSFTFSSKDFRMNKDTEVINMLPDGKTWREESDYASDWAYLKTNQKGNIEIDPVKASSLPVGIELHTWGFPRGMGAVDTQNFNPQYSSCKTAISGLDAGIIRIGNRNYEGGNSGGPVFYIDKGKLKAVGIVSYGKGDHFGGICPVSNLK